MIKRILLTAILAVFFTQTSASEKSTSVDDNLHKIKNFHFVSTDLASSGLLKLESYKNIQKYGFKHVINLIPGNQDEERSFVKSLGLSYEQIEVQWGEPALDDFEQFKKLIKSYKKDKIFVHCEANYRASTFVYLYRVTQLGVSPKEAQKDLLTIWKPSLVWTDFIEKVLFDSENESIN